MKVKKPHYHETLHHLVPQSRCHELGIKDKDDQRNLRKIDDEKHRVWHALFTNSTPHEVVHQLYALYEAQMDIIMLGRTEWTILFGTMNLLEVCDEVIRNWMPPQSLLPFVFYTRNNKKFRTFVQGLLNKQRP